MKKKVLTKRIVIVFLFIGFAVTHASEDMFNFENSEDGLNGYGVPDYGQPFNGQYNPFGKQQTMVYSIPVTIENQ